MAFFPESLMPLSPKENSPNGSNYSSARISSEGYNRHDEEILAIQRFLGAKQALSGFGVPRQELGARGSTTGTSGQADFLDGLLGEVKQMTSDLNAFSLDGIITSSGYANSGTQMIFPEDAVITYLRDIPGPNDNVINVSSTDGFPNSGVFSILNDVQQAVFNYSTNTWSRRLVDGLTTVEWIRYSSKSSSSFMGCTRGYLGTTAGTHGGNIELSRQDLSSEPLNLKDQQTFITTGLSYLARRNLAWRNRNYYHLPILGQAGSLVALEESVRTGAGNFRVMSDYSPSQLQKFINVAGQVGILGQRDTGSYYLKSTNGSNANQGILSPDEAKDFVTGAIVAGLATLEKEPNDFTWPQMSIPVVMGKMSISHGFAAGNGFERTEALQINQGADGTLWGFFNEDRSGEYAASSVLGYQITIVPSLRTMQDRNA